MLFVGDDWAEGHHDIEVQDEQGHRLTRARLPEGIAGLTRLHELLAEYLGEEDVDPETRDSQQPPRPMWRRGTGKARRPPGLGLTCGYRDQDL